MSNEKEDIAICNYCFLFLFISFTMIINITLKKNSLSMY
jgi:CRISPR-associated protein Cas8b1/Cst1 subtype I-B